MNWNLKRVFITGADGFIGSHLTEALIDAGAHVTALSEYNSFDRFGWLDDLPADRKAKTEIVRGDIRDSGLMRDIVTGQDIVFHLASLISIPYSYEAPQSYVRTNIEGGLNLMEAARQAQIERFIHTSTSEVYGTALATPITEDHPLQGQSPYSASKIGADMMAEAFARSFGLPLVTLRPFNTYGPRQSRRAVIATVIQQVLDPNCNEITVGNLKPKRDFCFVEDTVAAFLAVAGPEVEPAGTVYNAGTGRMISISEVVETILFLCDSHKPVVQIEARHRPENSEVMALQASAEKLNRATGWSPRVDLESGLKRTIDWWRARIAAVETGNRYFT